MRIQFRIALAFLCLFALTCCHPDPALQNSDYTFPNFEQTIGIDELLNNLIIEPVESAITLYEGSTIGFIITNDSGYSIQFPPGYGVRIFAYEGSKDMWVEVSNGVDYIGEGDLLGSKSEGAFNWIGYLTVSPDLPVEGRYEVVRVAVVGTISNSSSSDSLQVGTFVDLRFDFKNEFLESG